MYVFSLSLLFGFGGGWVGHWKSEHCLDFKKRMQKWTILKMRRPMIFIIKSYLDRSEKSGT